MRVSPRDPGLAAAATSNGMIFPSENGGASWIQRPFPVHLAGTPPALELDPRFPGTWYTGMEGDRVQRSGVYRKSDSGATWTQLPGLRRQAVWSLAIAPASARNWSSAGQRRAGPGRTRVRRPGP